MKETVSDTRGAYVPQKAISKGKVTKITAVAGILAALLPALSGCAGDSGASALASQVRDLYAGVQSISAQVRTTAEMTDRTSEFDLSWSYTAQDGSRVTVLEPEAVAGISATMSPDGLSFEYDGVVLEVGNLSGAAAVSPLEALPMMLSQWADGMQVNSSVEKLDGAETVALTYEKQLDDGRTLSQRTWFDRTRLSPLQAEFYIDGQQVLQCSFEIFDFQ